MTDHTATLTWRKSSHSQGQNACVEVTTSVPGRVGIRDSKLGPTSPILTVPAAEWRALLTAIRTDALHA